MKRPAKQDKVLERIHAWRAQVPGLAIRSTFIVGFPGETDADFEQLLDFIREAKIDRAGCFKYENVAHADSRDLPDHIPESIKDERWHRFMQVQSEISAARAAAQIGTQQEVIIDGPSDQAGTWQARTKADAPEVDGVVYLTSAKTLQPGQILSVEIDAADAYDLYAHTL